MYTDDQAYLAYPNLRHLYNKLWLSEKLGYYCGPSGIAPDRSDFYVVRPLMNLSGMGVGASKCWIDAGDTTKVPPGYFWCEWFEGSHYSATFANESINFNQISCFRGHKSEDNLSVFVMWKREGDVLFDLPKWLRKELSHVPYCNVEFIGSKIIEVHLRKSTDPEYNILIPIWDYAKEYVDKYSKLGYSYINSYDNADGFLERPRLGFMVK